MQVQHLSSAMSRTAMIETAAAFILEGKLVALPTETVYGLGANIFNENAVLEIFRVKRRPADNPLIVHVASLQQAMSLMLDVPMYFEELTNRFWPGPLTLVVQKNAAVLDCVTAGLASVALRMPDHSLTREVIRKAGVAIAAPSANISGRPSPTNAADVLEEMGDTITAVLDGGPCRLGIESTVLDLTGAVPVLLRPGSITREDIEAVIQTNVIIGHMSERQPQSPGMKYRHYSPRTPFRLLACEGNDSAPITTEIARYHSLGKKVALIAPENFSSTKVEAFFSLGNGAPVEYARLLYSALRTLDKAGVDVILCPAIPEEGIGCAVMNRLRKAEGRHTENAV